MRHCSEQARPGAQHTPEDMGWGQKQVLVTPALELELGPSVVLQQSPPQIQGPTVVLQQSPPQIQGRDSRELPPRQQDLSFASFWLSCPLQAWALQGTLCLLCTAIGERGEDLCLEARTTFALLDSIGRPKLSRRLSHGKNT